MKNLCRLAILAIAAVATGCGVTRFNASNDAVSQTQVKITEGNFRVIRNVEGFASATYIFGIGGLSEKATRENAIADMCKKAQLTGSQTIINIHVKQHISTILGIYMKISYSASGQVIEFNNATDNLSLAENTIPIVSEANSSKYKVGDYYSEGAKKGVIFDVSDDGMHGKIVCYAGKAQWSTEKNLVGCNSTTDGTENMYKVRKIDDWVNKYPAFALCAKLGDDWYLPPVSELQTIYINRNLINSTLKKHNNNIIYSSPFWSSTELQVNEAILLYGNKYYNKSKSAVRDVLAVAKF